MEQSTSSSCPGGPSPEGARKSRKVLDFRVLIGTFLALTAVGIVVFFCRGYQVRSRAANLAEHAEALAKEHKYTDATAYYTQYLELRPDDAGARLRRADLYEKTGPEGAQPARAIGLYQEALAAGKGLSPEKQLQAERRLAELMLRSGAVAPAYTEAEKVCELEKQQLPTKRAEWQGPGLRAMALAGKYLNNNASVSNHELEEAFAVVLEPKTADEKVFVDPDVYLARFAWRLQNALKQAKDANSGAAYLAASANANGDLDAALKLAPSNMRVLLAAADASQREALAKLAVAEDTPGKSEDGRQNAMTSYAKAIDYFQRAIQASPEDPRPYRELGKLYVALGFTDRAIQTWRRGLKEVKIEVQCVDLNLALADVLIQQGRLPDVDNILKDLNELLKMLDPQSRLSLQRSVNLRSAKLYYLRGHFDEAIHLVADLASGKVLIQGEESTATPQMRYEAWFLEGQSHAALGRLAVSNKDKQAHWNEAVTDFEQAAQAQPREVAPHVAAAEACRAAGQPDAAVIQYQNALEIINAQPRPSTGQRQEIYNALITLLEEQKHEDQAELYRNRRDALLLESGRYVMQGVTKAIGEKKYGEALDLALRGTQMHQDDAIAYLALGRAEQAKARAEQAGRPAERANVSSEKAADAYHRAFEIAKDTKDTNAAQMEMAGFLLATGDAGDAAVGEAAIRRLLPKHAPAYLSLVTFLVLKEKYDEATSIARDGVQTFPNDPAVHVALGTALWSKKDVANAEAAFREAVRIAPNVPGPARALLEFYINTDRSKLAKEMLDQFLATAKLQEVERESFCGDILIRLGDRKGALEAYRKAVEAAREDPFVVMRLVEALLAGNDSADQTEAERLLRRIKDRYDPARLRLADVLLTNGTEAEWDEAQKLLDQSASDPTLAVYRLAQARLLARRGGPQNLDKAATICRELIAEAKPPLPALNVLLAQVCELQGNLDEARKQYVALVDPEHPAAVPLVNYVAFLLRHGPPAETDQRLKQLEKMAPEDLVVLQMRARWLHGQKRTAEIEPSVEGVAKKILAKCQKENPQQEAQLVQAIGDLYSQIEIYSAAERWYRRLQKLNGHAYEGVAMSLAMQGRVQEAIALCEEAGKSDESLRPALVLASVLVSGRATPEDMKAAEPQLKKALESHKDQPALLKCLADLRVLQDRPQEGIALYRQILALQPKNVAALNDLATVLGEQEEAKSRKEALDCIERAIDLAGPQAALLDTQGMALFYDGQTERALTAMQAAQSPQPDPRSCFHLAVVLGRLGQLDKARVALQLARSGDLEHQLLTKKDRQLLAELDKQLAP